MAIHFYTYNRYKTHSGLLFRQTRFLKVNVFTLKYVTTAYSSHLSRDFTAFDQSFLQIIQKKEEYSVIFRKCYKDSERIKSGVSKSEKMEHFKISFIKGIARPLYNHAHVTVIANIILALIVEKAKAMKRRDIKS